MHECPRCGQGCNCSGDIDDSYVMTTDWVYANCDQNHNIGTVKGCMEEDNSEDDWEENSCEVG